MNDLKIIDTLKCPNCGCEILESKFEFGVGEKNGKAIKYYEVEYECSSMCCYSTKDFIVRVVKSKACEIIKELKSNE